MKRKIQKSISLLAVTLGITISFVVLNNHRHKSPLPIRPDLMARSFALWLHGLGDSGLANEPIKTFFTSAVFFNTKWNLCVCYANFPQDEGSVLKAVQNIHAVIDKEIAAGTNLKNVFICGFSQGGALTLASILLYPKTLGGGAVFSGWVPFNSSIIERVTEDAKKVFSSSPYPYLTFYLTSGISLNEC